MSEQIQKAWMDEKDKRSTLYEDGARDFCFICQNKVGEVRLSLPMRLTDFDGASVVGNMEEKNIEEDGLGIENFVDAYMGHGIETGDIEPPFVPEPDLGKSLGGLEIV
ncbi:hypothetical protein IFM89_026504 [Coptis chinensis]|uniref:Uncharacterized protein n=1 Tax=Coptis chinensis TaxID=261450 RepID=A0A835HNZ6_9MAGN|nr:hypothetical protein IFM89_026504 [Coptis chinensis]